MKNTHTLNRVGLPFLGRSNRRRPWSIGQAPRLSASNSPLVTNHSSLSLSVNTQRDVPAEPALKVRPLGSLSQSVAREIREMNTQMPTVGNMVRMPETDDLDTLISAFKTLKESFLPRVDTRRRNRAKPRRFAAPRQQQLHLTTKLGDLAAFGV